MTELPKILLVEDTGPLARLYQEYLEGEPVEIRAVPRGRDAVVAIREWSPALLLLDLNLPDMNGLEVLSHAREAADPPATIVITAHGSVDVAVEAMRAGAYDFLVKPVDAGRLLVTVRNALERQQAQTRAAGREAGVRDRYCGFIGRSPTMQAVYRMIDAAAASKATAMITGESGTGKEVCAEAIHTLSPRRDGPFVAVNCGAIPPELMESEMFGHVRGGFTGAVSDREGAAKRADGGTLFLDEICELDPALQSKLLRFVQTGTFNRVGGERTEHVDVRIVCATNRNPAEEVGAGRFREDLYYRLHVLPIHLAPLRQRGEDVLAIARHYLGVYAKEEGKRFRRLGEDVAAAVLAYRWPGNVRQLQNVIRNAVVLNDGEVLTRAMLPAPLEIVAGDGSAPTAATVASSEGWGGTGDADEARLQKAGVRPLREVERRAIESAIAACSGNVPRAALLLDVAPSTLYRKIKAWHDGGDT